MLQFICIFVNIFFVKSLFISIFHGEPLFLDGLMSVIREAEPGEFINAKVIGTKDYDLLVEQI